MEDIKKPSEVSFTYDPVKDIAPVDQFGFVDLANAYVNGAIPGDLSVNVEDYNGVEDPNSLIGRSSDVFEAYRKAQAVESSRSALRASEATAKDASSAASE